jgi:hypothetical protein
MFTMLHLIHWKVSKLHGHYSETLKSLITKSETNNHQLMLLFQMLGKLEEYLQAKKIPFFWDGRCNLISHLDPAEIQNILGRVKGLIQQLELALTQPDRDISSVMDKLFPL